MAFLFGSDLTCHKSWSIFSEAETAVLGYGKIKPNQTNKQKKAAG